MEMDDRVNREGGWTLVELILSLMLIGLLAWAVPAALACVTVWTHNRYWPIYPPGYCKGCGYCLRGLPEPRCPECGRAFDPAEVPKDSDDLSRSPGSC